MYMNPRLLTLALAATQFAILTSRSSAELIGADDFSYPDGTISNKAGGIGFDWNNLTKTHTGSTSNWDVVGGSPGVSGGDLVTISSSAKREYNGPTSGTPGTSDEREGAVQGFRDVVVYYRVEMTRGAGTTWSGVSSYDFGQERVFFGAPDFGNRFGIEVLNSGDLDGITYSEVDVNDNQTYTLVAKLDFGADLLSLYVDPDVFAAESQQTPVVTRPYTGTNWSTAARLGSGGGRPVAWDGLVVADSWEDLGAFAPMRVVTNGNDSGSGSLREAVERAQDGDRIVFDPREFNDRENFVFLQSNISVIGKSISIDASDIAGGITILGFTDSPPNFGGIFQLNTGVLQARSITFRDGRANCGGAVSSTNGGMFTAINCVFDSNVTQGRGGAVYNQSTCILHNCTFTGNSSPLGAAIHTEGGSASTTVRHCTVSGNSSPSGHAVSSGVGADCVTTVFSSIISGNNVDADIRGQRADNYVSEGFNLIGTGSAALLGVFNQPGDDTGVTDPMLAPLTWNGGTTQTRLPLPGSPALESGGINRSSPAFDARGLPRTLGAFSDVGAAEADWNYNVADTVDRGFGYFEDITCPDDTVFALPIGNKPNNERVFNAIDNEVTTKYLNFERLNAGLEVIPCAGRSRIVGFTITSANDVPGRDPATFQVIGHNPGKADVVIAAGEVPAFSGRRTKQEFFFERPSVEYEGYSLMFPSVSSETPTVANDSMQIAELELLGAPADPSIRILSFEVTNVAPLRKDWTMRWTSWPGRTYALEFSDDLRGWERYADVSSDGFTTTFSTFDPVLDHRYHRVVDLAADTPLWIDFNSTTQDGGPHPQGGLYQSYDAGHEVAADFTTMNYTALGTTVSVTPAWPNSTDSRVQQMIDRGAGNDNNWIGSEIDLVTDFLGIDSRTGSGGNGDWDGVTGTPTYMTLTLGNLPSGTYDWLSFHHDTENVHGPFSVDISTDGGATFTQLPDGVMTDSTPLGNPDSMAEVTGPDAASLSSAYMTTFAASGNDDVVLRFAPYAGFAVHRQIWGINGFLLRLR